MKNLLPWPKLQCLKGGDFFFFFTRESDSKYRIQTQKDILKLLPPSLSLSLSQNSANISDALNLICNLLPL